MSEANAGKNDFSTLFSESLKHANPNSTTVQACDSGIAYTMTSAPGNPLVIGAFVLPASQYLGGNPQLSAFVVPRRR